MAMHSKNTPNVRSSARTKTRNGQWGGTLLGLIIGLVIGLGIALAVALSITKTGLPFISKGAQPRAAEGSSGAIVADPNKPLYGNKDAAKEAANNFAKPAEDAVPMVGLPPPEPEPHVAAKPATESGKAPVVEKSVTEKSAAAKPDTGEDKYTYYLQAGAFREQADADNTKAKLALLGFEARVTPRLSDSGTLYRVRVGPFAQTETMNRIREKLSENGVDVAVVRVPK
jgi:cell division protein FtsN